MKQTSTIMINKAARKMLLTAVTPTAWLGCQHRMLIGLNFAFCPLTDTLEPGKMDYPMTVMLGIS